MRKIVAFSAVAALIIASLGAWVVAASKTNSIARQSVTISTHDLHIKTDVKSLPLQTIEDPL